jgi:hypothetical protein
MFSCSHHINNAIPAEYREIAEKLFPPGGFPAEEGPSTAAAFAGILGIDADYQKLLATENTGAEMRSFLGHFQNNLDLLIQKTWVEKADETRKEKLQDTIPALIADIEAGRYRKALAEFGDVLEELAYLLFGAQSHKDDFIEYALRIDEQMGLFWWYGGQIGRLALAGEGIAQNVEDPSGTDAGLRAILFIGLCYLTNF